MHKVSEICDRLTICIFMEFKIITFLFIHFYFQPFYKYRGEKKIIKRFLEFIGHNGNYYERLLFMKLSYQLQSVTT